MSQQAIIQAVRDQFDTLVATPESLRVIHDNAPEPSSRTQNWVRFSVQVDGNEQVSMGVDRFRMTGAATALIFFPVGKGDKGESASGALQLADKIVTAFRRLRIASPDIAFTPPPGVIGVAEQDEAWCRRTVLIPFRADTVET